MSNQSEPKPEPKPTENLQQFLGLTQSGLALLTAVGAGGALHAAWNRATLRLDERLLIDLSEHEQARERAKQIATAANTEPKLQEELKALAAELDENANENLRYAIARMRWHRSVARDLGFAGLAIGLFLLFVGLGFSLEDHDNVAWWFARFGLVLTAVGLADLTIGRTIFLDRRVKNMKPGTKAIPKK